MENNSYVQKQYWSTLTYTDYSITYYNKLQKRFACIAKVINIFSAIMATSSVALWSFWGKIPWLWPILIAFAELIHVVWPLISVEKLIPKLINLIYATRQEYLIFEKDWLYVRNGELTEKEINDKISKFKMTINKLEKDILDGYTITIYKNLLKKSEIESNKYFENNFY